MASEHSDLSLSLTDLSQAGVRLPIDSRYFATLPPPAPLGDSLDTSVISFAAPVPPDQFILTPVSVQAPLYSFGGSLDTPTFDSSRDTLRNDQRTPVHWLRSPRPATALDMSSSQKLQYARRTLVRVCSPISAEAKLLNTTETNNILLAPRATPTKNRKKHGGGWPKGKARKIRDATDLKTPVTAYNVFAKERQAQLRSSNALLTFGELAQIVGEEWSKMSTCDKQVYKQIAERDRLRYKTDVAAKRAAATDIVARSLCDDMTDLRCEVCDVDFSSEHNKREHVRGRPHLLKVQEGCAGKVVLKLVDIPRKRHRPKSAYFTSLGAINQLASQIFQMDKERKIELCMMQTHVSELESKKQAAEVVTQALEERQKKLEADLHELISWQHFLSQKLRNLTALLPSHAQISGELDASDAMRTVGVEAGEVAVDRCNNLTDVGKCTVTEQSCNRPVLRCRKIIVVPATCSSVRFSK